MLSCRLDLFYSERARSTLLYLQRSGSTGRYYFPVDAFFVALRFVLDMFWVVYRAGGETTYTCDHGLSTRWNVTLRQKKELNNLGSSTPGAVSRWIVLEEGRTLRDGGLKAGSGLRQIAHDALFFEL